MSVTDLDECAPLLRHRRGDPGAFTELVMRWQGPVYGYLVRCGVDPAVRDDCFQEVFTRIHRSADTFHADRPLKPWIFMIVANVVRTHFRRQRVQALVFGDTPPADLPDPRPDPYQLASARQTAD